ncbi:MAG: hypothetical protein HYT11_00070 [Candidatus Levybacteria bacterium]|nr:hypothetical protein [Candidatus Levybacteria bacterium]
MSYSYITHDKAISLRKKGFSLKEVSEHLHISKSTASIWLSSIELSSKAQGRLANKQILGQYKTVLLKKEYRDKQMKKYEFLASRNMKNIILSKDLSKLLCTLLWWCEGNKDTKVVRFTSSDKTLIANFLHVFRSGFNLNESKFRALVHIHNYHDDLTQKSFWSNVTKIPLKQFYASFQKKNTGKRIHKDYAGCIAISYYDARIAKELLALYNAFTYKLGGVR